MSVVAFDVFPRAVTVRAPAPETNAWRDMSVVFIALFTITLGALLVDERLLNGISVWIKPLKFQASLALHFATLVLVSNLLSGARRRAPAFRALVAASTAAGLFEIGYIMLQAARGRASHFNYDTVLEAVMYILMGVGAVMLVVAPLVIGVWLWRDSGRSLRSDPLRLAAALGLVLSAVATLIIAGYMSGSGAHWVGDVTSDAGGLPLVGWSQRAGDLRVAHFFATHGMQVLPLLGFALRERGTRGSFYVIAATAGWLAITAAVFLQALLGHPFAVLH